MTTLQCQFTRLAAILTIFAAICPAQYLPRPFSGSIKTRDSVLPAQRIEVVLLTSDGRPRERVFADGQGNFQLTTLAPGNRYIIIIDVPGYRRIEQNVESSPISSALNQRIFILEPLEAKSAPESPSPVSAERLRLPREAQQAMEKGEKELKKKNYAKAGEHFDKVLALAPDFAEALQERASVFLQMNEPARAEDYFRKALTQRADYAEALLGLGAALARQGNQTEAIERLTKGLALHPKSYLGLFERCRANLSLGNAEAALADCEAAKLNADGARPELLVLQGNLYLRLNRNPEALREFQNYLKQDNSSATAGAVRDLVGRMKKAGIKAAP